MSRFGQDECAFPRVPIEGFEHTVLSGTMSSARLRFGLDLSEVWKAWCELQTPVADTNNPGQYNCLPNGGTGFTEEEGCVIPDGAMNHVPVDCCKMSLCLSGWGGSTCACTEDGCTMPFDGPAVQFDLKIEGDSADGSVVGIGEVGLVRLLRSP